MSAPAPQFFIHAYIWCDDYEGELAHSCQHGKHQHHIKICITKTDNERLMKNDYDYINRKI